MQHTKLLTSSAQPDGIVLLRRLVARAEEHTLDEGEGADVGVDQLLLDYETQCSKHADTAVSHFRLSPPAEISDGVVAGSGAAQKVERVEDVGEWLGDASHLLGICNKQIGVRGATPRGGITKIDTVWAQTHCSKMRRDAAGTNATHNAMVAVDA